MTPVSLPRSRDVADLASQWDFLELPARGEHSIMDSVADALSYWGPRLGPDDAVLATGSCFLVAEFLHRLGVQDLEQTRHARPAASVLPR
jgi:hypothetical protein